MSSRSQLIKYKALMCKIGIREAKSSLKSGRYSATHLSITISSELAEISEQPVLPSQSMLYSVLFLLWR